MSVNNESITEWYTVSNIAELDSPALLVFPERVQKNIELAKTIIGDVQRLRPHVKTNKTVEVSQLLLAAGITRFKCATIAEAEMLATVNAPDVLLAYQPTGPKIGRLINLVKAYPATRFSCLVDEEENAKALSAAAQKNAVQIPVYIDVNIGMDRTGIKPENTVQLVKALVHLPGIKVVGLHAYDGHIRDIDLAERKQKTDQGFEPVQQLRDQLEVVLSAPCAIVVGGTPTFPVHARRPHVECSPGTFVFSDWGYKHALPDEAFDYAAVLVSRVISIIDAKRICIDLGHKSVAAENALDNRVRFFNAPGAIPLGQSEEHLVLQVPDSTKYRIGDVLYGVPIHICPTVALYDKIFVVEEGLFTGAWKVVARNRSINF